MAVHAFEAQDLQSLPCACLASTPLIIEPQTLVDFYHTIISYEMVYDGK